jgi:parallel beta-helix repeat protein
LLRQAVSGIMLTLLSIGMLTLAFNIRQVKTAETIIVPDDYSTIQKAINAATNGDTIFVSSGTYYENVVLNKSLSLVAENENAIIDGGYSESEAVLSIQADNVSVVGFSMARARGVFLSSSSDCEVRDNNIEAAIGTGIWIEGGVNNSIVNNDAGAGIVIENSDRNVIMQNAMDAHHYSIWLIASDFNYISRNSLGIHWGIICISLYRSNSNTIEWNTLYDSGFQMSPHIELIESSSNLIYHNNLLGLDCGVYLDQESVNNTWDNGYPFGGNYWCDYGGSDSCCGRFQNETGSDGIGDTPHIIDENNQDNYPLMKIWSPVKNLNTSLFYSTIQGAIDAPETLGGHAICVPSRKYCESVVVNKSVSIIGQNKDKTFIQGCGSGTVFTITEDSVHVTGFTVRNAAAISDAGIVLMNVSSCRIRENNIVNNSYGIQLYKSLNNNISDNNMVANNYGISLDMSYNNTFSENNIVNSTIAGIVFSNSSSNTIYGNNVTNNYCGVHLEYSSGNRFYHNNFIENSETHVDTSGYVSFWDDNYPSGGNYWSDYKGIDDYSGPYQNETGSDGIGDSPYTIDEHNIDDYPLMHPSYVHPSVRNLDTRLDYFRIQEALEAQETTNGHTIKVGSGTYYENVHINKSVSLIGENKRNTVIDGNFTGTVVCIAADNVTFTDFTIQNGGAEGHGVEVSHSRGCSIENNIVSDNFIEMKVTESSNNTIADNFVFCQPDQDGIMLNSSDDNTLINNIISCGHVGFSLEGSDYNIVNGNRLHSSWSGIRLADSNNNTIVANKIFNSTTGIYIASYNSSGINNLLFHNNLINNTLQALEINSTNVWHSGYPSGGNYWSDYNGTDYYRGPFQNITGWDGIGDAPYIIPYMNNSDIYPLMNPYGFPIVKMVPDIVELGPGYIVEQNFTVAVVVENIDALCAIDLRFSWNTTYLEYVNHKVTIPVEDYPDPIPPSPYGGILHAPELGVKDEVNEAAGTYWTSFSSLGGLGFYGSGTVCIFTFKVKNQSTTDVQVPLHFTSTELVNLVNSEVVPIQHAVKDGLIRIARLPPDIAITNIEPSRTLVGERYVIHFNVTVENQGGYAANFNLSLHANTTFIDTITNITLAIMKSRTLTFKWNTCSFAKGNYTISAYVEPVPYEIDITDNTLTDGVVLLTIPGDVDGDLDVDIYDIVRQVGAYGSVLGDPNYDANCDVDGDGDIDIYDVVAMCNHYGETYP